MKSILNALQEGRLIELPDEDKESALEYLALIIEAIPDIGTGADIVKEVLDREKLAPTGLGKGVACPHARTKNDGELLCAVGWSPKGIDFASPDGKKVHLVFMYFIPDSKRNVYLKEISGLAQALQGTGGIEALEVLKDIHEVRDRLLDWVEIASAQAVPDVKARLIKLEARQMKEEAKPGAEARKIAVTPFTVLVTGPSQGFILSRDDALSATLEKDAEIFNKLIPGAEFDVNGYSIAVYETESYPRNRTLFRCVSIKL